MGTRNGKKIIADRDHLVNLIIPILMIAEETIIVEEGKKNVAGNMKTIMTTIVTINVIMTLLRNHVNTQRLVDKFINPDTSLVLDSIAMEVNRITITVKEQDVNQTTTDQIITALAKIILGLDQHC